MKEENTKDTKTAATHSTTSHTAKTLMERVPFCSEAGCPFKDCDFHLERLREISDSVDKSAKVRVTTRSAFCRRYIGWLIDSIERGETE